MRFKSLARAALAATAATGAHAAEPRDDNTPVGQSTFISPDGSLAFGFTVPDNGNADVYFSLRVPTSRSWGAVGLGSDDMPGALYLMIYQNEKGDNVTFSPRLTQGHYEPEYYDGLEWEALAGTGISDDHMMLNARCSNCRSWPSGGTDRGYIDVSSATQKTIYALGPSQGFQSDDPRQGIRFHEEYGTFTIDMKRTRGSADTPALTDDSEGEGTTLGFSRTGKSDWKSTMHAVFMVVGFVLLMPLGVIILRIGGKARWHGLNQTAALIFVLVGFSMGVVTSLNYQRSRKFHSYHQIIGIIVTVFVLAQFSLGFLHHHKFRKTNLPTKFGDYHRWIGRLILFFGIINAFFGFTFAMNRKYGSILAGLIIAVCFCGLFLIFGRAYLDKQKKRQAAGPPGPPRTEPWRTDPQPGQSTDYPNEPPPGYEASSSHIDLRPVSPSPWRRNSAEAKELDDGAALGSMQRPREFA